MSGHESIINRFFLVLCFALLLLGCKEPEARRPITVKTGEFFKKSVERNKNLLKQEQEFIKKLIAQDSLHTYHSSPNGYWYFYHTKDSTGSYTPKPDDVVLISYDIRYLNDSIIYSKEEIGEVRFRVDKEDLFPGLRTAVKLLKKGETATFMFPSSLAYGYHGDENRIGINVPLKSTISLLDTLSIDSAQEPSFDSTQEPSFDSTQKPGSSTQLKAQ